MQTDRLDCPGQGQMGIDFSNAMFSGSLGRARLLWGGPVGCRGLAERMLSSVGLAAGSESRFGCGQTIAMRAQPEGSTRAGRSESPAARGCRAAIRLLAACAHAPAPAMAPEPAGRGG